MLWSLSCVNLLFNCINKIITENGQCLILHNKWSSRCYSMSVVGFWCWNYLIPRLVQSSWWLAFWNVALSWHFSCEVVATSDYPLHVGQLWKLPILFIWRSAIFTMWCGKEVPFKCYLITFLEKCKIVNKK